MSLEGLVAGKGVFPTRRKAVCCGNQVRPGESVVILHLAADKGVVVLHRRCLVQVTDKLPLDARDYDAQFARLRKRILKKGAFMEE